MTRESILRDVVGRALAEVAERGIRIYTIALYHDHESAAVSVCVDTRDNSDRQVREQNRYNMKHCLRAIQIGSLREALSWQANVGRNLWLGDFEAVDLARTDIPQGIAFWRTPRVGTIAMAQALMAFEGEIRRLSLDPAQTVLACSGPEDEVALVWALSESPPN